MGITTFDTIKMVWPNLVALQQHQPCWGQKGGKKKEKKRKEKLLWHSFHIIKKKLNLKFPGVNLGNMQRPMNRPF